MNNPGTYTTALTGQPAATTLALHELLRFIESEYYEMPGLCVSAAQAERLWGLDSTTCSFVLKTLVERRVLRRTARGTYLRN